MTQHQNQPRQPFAQESEQEWSLGESMAPLNAASMTAVQGAADESPQIQQLKSLQKGANARNRTFQLKASSGFAEPENNTGIPDQLKAGVEGLSGMDLNDVKVHYNSDKPAQLQAHAYAQGSDIHLGPGQEEHLPHEAWHVAQQKQGRVTANTTSGSCTPVNDNLGLEQEADVMGAKAMQFKDGE